MRRIIIMWVIVVSLVLLTTTCEKKEYAPEEIELISYNGLFFMDLEINESKARFLLDTGANSSYIDTNKLNKFKLSVSKKDTGINLTGIGGAGGTVQELHKFKLFKSNAKEELPNNIYFKSINLSNIKLNIDGILGGDYLKANKAVINYRDNTLILN